MLQDMKELGLDYLQEQLSVEQIDGNRESWYKKLHKRFPEKLIPFLTESSDNMEKVFVVRPSPEETGLAILDSEELTKERKVHCPFVAQTGNVPQIGPLFKPNKSKKGISPKSSIILRTIAVMELQADTKDAPWAFYFASVLSVLQSQELLFRGERYSPEDRESLIELAIRLMDDEAKAGVFLAISDEEGRLPGEVPEYSLYLQHILSLKKYQTKEAPMFESGQCSCCGEVTSVYPNGLKGTGLNLFSVDRDGAFPGVLLGNAYKRFALCLPCADLLYIYYQRVLPSFFTFICGDKSLVVPVLLKNFEERGRFLKRFSGWLEGTKGEEMGVADREKRLMRFLSSQENILSLQIIWATFGQELKDVEGMLTDILPSRLRELSELNLLVDSWQSPIFPSQRHPALRFSLALPALGLLLRRRGPQAKNKNKSPRVKSLKRDLLAALYKGHSGQHLIRRFWNECYDLAVGRFLEVFHNEKLQGASRKISYLIYETSVTSKTKITTPISLATWVQFLALFLHYLRTAGVFPMNQHSLFQPEFDELKPYFGLESGIDSKPKAFAFLTGVLFGKLLQVQAGRGVNLSSNALTWLKRFRLKGSDLPELYNKIRSRFLVYGTEGSQALRAVSEEVAMLGVELGSNIELSVQDTCYFLLLGQSLSTRILPSKTTSEES